MSGGGRGQQKIIGSKARNRVHGLDWIVYTDVEVAKNNKIIERKKMSKGECLRSQEVAAGDRKGR